MCLRGLCVCTCCCEAGVSARRSDLSTILDRHSLTFDVGCSFSHEVARTNIAYLLGLTNRLEFKRGSVDQQGLQPRTNPVLCMTAFASFVSTRAGHQKKGEMRKINYPHKERRDFFERGKKRDVVAWFFFFFLHCEHFRFPPLLLYVYTGLVSGRSDSSFCVPLSPSPWYDQAHIHKKPKTHNVSHTHCHQHAPCNAHSAYPTLYACPFRQSPPFLSYSLFTPCSTLSPFHKHT